MKLFKQTLPFVLGIVLISPGLFAQGQQMQGAQPDSITDQELQKFVNTTDSLQVIQQETRDEVETIVKDEGMEFERFQEIMMSKENPQMAQDVEVTEEEEKTIENVEPQLEEISRGAQQQFVQAIQQEGLTPQRFQQIMQAVRSDPAVSQRFQEMVGGLNQN